MIEEDQLVAELHKLGVTYLSNRPTEGDRAVRPPERILADCVRAPSSRVRTAVIALLLLHPGFAKDVPPALDRLNPQQRLLLTLFYTAAVYLQRQYQADLRPIVASAWSWLPDLFSPALNVSPDLSPREAVRQLGVRHQELTHSLTNWAGTYENAAHHLIRYKQREAQWNQSQPKP